MKYETIELDLNEMSKEALISLVKYSIDENITIEQAINRTLIQILLINDPSFYPEKVECTYCGTMFYGDVFSRCSYCIEPYDQSDLIQIMMFNALNEALPLWMIIDKDGEYLR